MKGYSLPELLVALVCSSLLMLIMMDQFIGVKQHYKQAEAILESKLEIQVVVDLMRASIRQAGFTPCLSIDKLSVTDTRARSSDLHALVLFHEAPAGLQINHMSNQYGLVLKQITPFILNVTKESTYSRQKPILIADCYHAEVHTLESIHSFLNERQLHLKQPMVYTYQSPVYVGEWYEERFFTQADTLYYQMGRSDALTSTVHHLTASVKNSHGKRVLNVLLNMANHKTLAFNTYVRSA